MKNERESIKKLLNSIFNPKITDDDIIRKGNELVQSLSSLDVSIENKPHVITGQQVILSFKNGYKMSCVNGVPFYTNGGELWEVALLDNEYGVIYDYDKFKDVIGCCSPSDIYDLALYVNKKRKIKGV